MVAFILEDNVILMQATCVEVHTEIKRLGDIAVSINLVAYQANEALRFRHRSS